MLQVTLSENIAVAEGTELCYKLCCTCCYQQLLAQLWQHLVLALSRAVGSTLVTAVKQGAGGTGLYCHHQRLEQVWQLCVQVLVALRCGSTTC